MRRAMETRAAIEQAKGILVAQHHCTPEQAFELLIRMSQTTHRKLRDCATDLVTSTIKTPEHWQRPAAGIGLASVRPCPYGPRSGRGGPGQE
jgi:hypothetical protein